MFFFRFQSEIYTISTDGTIETIFKVKMNAGQVTLNNFEQFMAEANRLGLRFEDRNFYYDESPEVPGLMAWMLTYGGNIISK